MITGEITICGKTVTAAYCYATEIAYKDLIDENITDYIKESVPLLQNNEQPDMKKTLFFVLASIVAYYEESKMPVRIEDLMRDATPEEVYKAIGTIIGLRLKFYNVPSGEPDDEGNAGDKEDEGKN